ncbi:MAG: Na+/H+ antiporter subunit E [Candidatus Nezhaarchaeota archaeon]|nr:Na+/H+ antiporter subunit E [Candidatus Nezhaarchaeota archaeon]MCX8142323.1 Na+/H+ antiporter subunit E [Candidatus Nezhaarchaeota archaeon]MDW8050704.1 Na+/H+ antiporter subunit E [Nitrososphaerota archaeon]
MSRILSFIVALMLLFTVFLIVSASISPMDVILGLVASIVVAAFTSTLIIREAPQKALNVTRWAWAVLFFLYYILVMEPKCHWDVIKRILHPKAPIKPGIVRVPYKVRSDYAITAVACSITNTPGTVVIDVDEGEKKRYYVHWIDVKTMDEERCYEMISKTFEYYVRKVFD